MLDELKVASWAAILLNGGCESSEFSMAEARPVGVKSGSMMHGGMVRGRSGIVGLVLDVECRVAAN